MTWFEIVCIGAALTRFWTVPDSTAWQDLTARRVDPRYEGASDG